MTKSLMTFSGSEDQVFTQPFTLADRKNTVWTIASDKVWFVAARGGTAPRFQGPVTLIGTLLKLVQAEPTQGRSFDPKDLLTQLEGLEGLCRVLGVVVSVERLKTLLQSCPSGTQVWDASSFFGSPGLGFSTPTWKAYLMGFKDVRDPVDNLTLEVLTPGDLMASLDED